MNKNFMAYLLIILGIVLTVSGIVMLTKQPKETVVVHSYDVASKAKSDTVYMQAQPQERVVEKTVVVEKEVEAAPAQTSAPADDRTPEEIVGQSFEDYVVNFLADKRFTLLDRTMDRKTSEGVYAESCKNPDLHISQTNGSRSIDYYIECKYRSSWKSGLAEIKQYQIDRYKEFQRKEHRKVLFALGVGGKPEAPQTLMIVPLDSIKGAGIKQDWIGKYQIPQSSDGFYNYMASYFGKVFQVAADRKKKYDR
jgi:hypothetical protein